ncbi:MAG: glycosyltransferase family 2 protein [Ktedonobacterales bacterium]|nr:glycosyltransferase family 2 protein [Ktedonobacterales bacterium]
MQRSSDLFTAPDEARLAADEQPPQPLTARGISVVLPAWNEEGVIAATVRNVGATLSLLAPNYTIIVVDDGSLDRTPAILDDLAAADARVRVIHHAANRGYGAALISGFDAAATELVFFMDSDGQFDISDIADLIIPYEAAAAAVILGYRQRRQDPPMRILNAWAWKQLVSFLFGLRVRDIDCAFKLMPTRLVQCAGVHAQGAMVNTELLAKFVRMQVTMLEVPVNHYPRTAGKATGANLRVIVHAFRELFRLAGKLRNWQPAPDDQG